MMYMNFEQFLIATFVSMMFLAGGLVFVSFVVGKIESTTPMKLA